MAETHDDDDVMGAEIHGEGMGQEEDEEDMFGGEYEERGREEPGMAHAREEEEFGEDITGVINGERDWPTTRQEETEGTDEGLSRRKATGVGE